MQLSATSRVCDSPSTKCHWSRLLAGHLFEIAHFLRRESNREVIRRFAKGLPDKPRRVYRELLRPDFSRCGWKAPATG